jgi:hypothetical protein
LQAVFEDFFFVNIENDEGMGITKRRAPAGASKSAHFDISLDGALGKRAKAFANRTGRTFSGLVAELLERELREADGGGNEFVTRSELLAALAAQAALAAPGNVANVHGSSFDTVFRSDKK